jgi:hypothetical protein
MRFAGGPLDREDISLGAALVGLVVAHKCRYGRVFGVESWEFAGAYHGTNQFGRRHMRKASYIASIVIGAILIVAGVATWVVVSTTLADQKITVSEDASCLAGDTVDGPFSAYCEAKIIEKHALSATGGKYYSELDRDDPLRVVAANSAYLQASLFTSVVAFGVAGMAILVGVLFGLIGLGMRDVDQQVARSEDSA